ncbi:PREDICTED: protein myomaker [Condylura cristata]|uniref:protein myomaker n=1 Tax=Condylura cristata TaxID=143302 RepID=UPI0006432C6C|nr:PREDICTED: protein myomaker [Condylura cristata]
MGTLAAKLLLPTLSSLAFLPTVSIAARRRFHMEAMVYLFTMFFVALQQMKEKRGLYPDKSVYTQQIGPGLCFGALALMLRFFFEDWDYTYVHSFYHCALAMSFALLLPKLNKKAGGAGAPAKLDCSTLCCACV